MIFYNRQDAGEQLGDILLSKLKEKNVIVLALPRGGVVVAERVAHKLCAPLDLVITRKIGHPAQPEYALAAVGEHGPIVGNEKEIASVDRGWFLAQVKKERAEAGRRRAVYLRRRRQLSVKGKVVVLVDDGVATGLTMQAAIREVGTKMPRKIVVAVAVAPKETVAKLREEVNEVVALVQPEEFYAIGQYYEHFPQVSDEEVIARLHRNRLWKS